MTGIRWGSLATVVVGGVIFLVCLVGLVLGHPWSAVPGVLGLLTAVREVRYLRRLQSGKISGKRENSHHEPHTSLKDSSRRPWDTR
ncbi:hypothetical protein GCM10010413_53280 [Promicromonospora sukumoe]|uniref:Uncharacterized protein n=1 Tax=Promicromonospora sukumoe TaxID=88382 RepID=A0A7W3JCX4_9MICO|nr:hypothetical protein [Promicromonospora sukumoe]MBA8810531.1 hypothetical protein [Promicromonospora sukumoe]